MGDHRHAGSPVTYWSLKGLIYDEVRLHELKTEAMPGFRLEAQQQLAYPMILTGSEAQALLQMTPFAWRAKAEVHAALRQQPTLVARPIL